MFQSTEAESSAAPSHEGPHDPCKRAPWPVKRRSQRGVPPPRGAAEHFCALAPRGVIQINCITL